MSHIALAVKDIAATHRFYTELMGFELVKVEVVPQNGGFARHVFYTTGPKRDQLIAFWDLANVPGVGDLKTDICKDLGLAPMTNHIAFTADDLQDVERKKQRWLAGGKNVLEIDHGWIHSIYTEDPDGITVEFAVMTRDLTADDAREAQQLLEATAPPASSDPKISLHYPEEKRGQSTFPAAEADQQ